MPEVDGDLIEPRGPAAAAMGLAPPAPKQSEPRPMTAGGGAQLVQAAPDIPDIDREGLTAPPPAATGGGRVGLVDPSNPYKLPPAAAQVVGVIRSSEGTAAKQGYFLYGGQPFVPGYEHPAREGWQGASGPAGPTHAAGAGQWQPGTWDDEVKRAKELGINLDFGKGADQDWAIWDRASRLYKNATGRDLAADQAAGKADMSVLGNEWAGLLKGTGSTTLRGWGVGVSPELKARIDSVEADAQRYAASHRATTEEIMRQANAAPAGSRERDEAIAKLREREHEYAMKYEEVASHPPVLKPVDALSNFGSAASIVGLLGGLFARRHLTTALAASGAAMKAINQNNFDEFQRQYKVWEQQSTTALNMVKLHNDEIRALIDDKKMAEDEKNSRLSLMLQAQGRTQAADTMVLGVNERLLSDQMSLERAAQSAAQQKALFQDATYNMLFSKYVQEMSPEDAAVKAGRESGKLPAGSNVAKPGTEPEFIQNAIKIKESEVGHALTGSEKADVEKQAHSDWAKARATGTSEAGYDLSQKIYGDETIGMVADSFLAGNDRAMVGMARQNVGAYAMARVWKAISEKMSAQETREFEQVYGRTPSAAEQKVLDDDRGRRLSLAQAEFQGVKAGERQAFTRAAGLVTAAAEAKQFTPLALEASKKVSRTEFPDLNHIQMAVQEKTGNKDVIDFHVANLSLADAFAQVIGRGNSQLTDAARNQAMSLLNKYWTEGQYESAVRMINKEIDAAQKAPEEVIKRFREGFLQRAIAAPVTSVGAEPPAGMGRDQPAGTPPVPSSLQGKTLRGWSPSTQRFYDNAGKSYDANGREMP